MDTPAENARREGYEAALGGRQEGDDPYHDDEMLSLEWRKGFGIGLGERSDNRQAD